VKNETPIARVQVVFVAVKRNQSLRMSIIITLHLAPKSNAQELGLEMRYAYGGLKLKQQRDIGW
jgi:hypothetical protein